MADDTSELRSRIEILERKMKAIFAKDRSTESQLLFEKVQLWMPEFLAEIKSEISSLKSQISSLKR